MLSPTILSINWFFSFILLRHLDGIQRNSQASIFRNTMVHRIFLYFLSEKREGLAFERLKFASSTTGPSEKQDTRTNAQARIIGLICRKGLGTRRADVWGNARHFCDGELNYKDTRANAQGRIIGNKHRKGLGTSRADVCWNGRRPCEPEFNSKDVRHRAQKWNVGPERRKGLGTSRADVSGNARHFCDDELNYN